MWYHVLLSCQRWLSSDEVLEGCDGIGVLSKWWRIQSSIFVLSTQWEGSYLEVRKTTLIRNGIGCILCLRFLSSELKQMSVAYLLSIIVNLLHFYGRSVIYLSTYLNLYNNVPPLCLVFCNKIYLFKGKLKRLLTETYWILAKYKIPTRKSVDIVKIKTAKKTVYKGFFYI